MHELMCKRAATVEQQHAAEGLGKRAPSAIRKSKILHDTSTAQHQQPVARGHAAFGAQGRSARDDGAML
jgi:hypothetical protein